MSPHSAFVPSLRAQQAGGQPIGELMLRELENPNLISLAAGFVDKQTLPVELTAQVFQQIWADPQQARDALQYGSTMGDPTLRKLLWENACRDDGVEHVGGIKRVMITAGGNQLLHLVTDTICNPGDIVLCSAPTYFVYLGVLKNLGVRARSVASDEQGMIPEALEQTLAELREAGLGDRVKAIYIVPYFNNPCGALMPVERVERIVRTAQKHPHRLLVIADEAYRKLRYEGSDSPSASSFDPEGQTVIAAGTFSKAFSPGIRVGWGLLPAEIAAAAAEQKGNIDFGSPNLSQQMMARVLQGGLLEQHLTGLLEGYREKWRASLEAAEQFLSPLPEVSWRRPQGGMYVWVNAPPHVETGMQSKLFEEALRRGVMYVPGEHCYPAEGAAIAKNTMRLSFGAQSSENIRRGFELLAEAIKAVESRLSPNDAKLSGGSRVKSPFAPRK